MEVVRASSGSNDSARPRALRLPPEIVERAAQSLCWVSIVCAVTSVVTFMLQNYLQPEMAAMLAHPFQRLTTLGLVFLSLGFLVVLRAGWVSKEMLLDVGTAFRVVVAFAIGVYETGMPITADTPVRGLSGVAVWMVFTGFLLPNSPLKAGLAAAGSVVAWPLAYWVNLQVHGFEPAPMNRLFVWMFPIVIMAVWSCVINARTIRMEMSKQKAEDLGSYQLDFMIGRGGMGEVWRARHKMLARDAAIKLIRPEMLAGVSGRQEQIARRRFELEAQATASLRSPHTVALFDFGQTKDRAFYYVMELLDGVDLQTLVERYGPLAESRVVKILVEVCESLEEAHRHGLVHRDIKPKNILLCRLGLQYDFVKVLDFGLVKSLQGSDMSLMTLDGTATGTPAYLSPEVAMGEAKIDGRADLYSLGCVAYFLLTGQMVFNETNPTALALAHVQKAPVPLRDRTELKISEGLEAIVLKLLEKDPANRPRSAQELSRLLRSLVDIPRWSKEQAMEWWQTNLPETAATVVSETSADKLEPVGAQLKG